MYSCARLRFVALGLVALAALLALTAVLAVASPAVPGGNGAETTTAHFSDANSSG